jgi:hypothetical protein
VKLQLIGVTVLAAGAIGWGSASAAVAPQAVPLLWKNCKHVNVRYPHGVGRMGAHDKTSGTHPGHQLQTQHFPVQDCNEVQPRARSRQGRHRLRKALRRMG